MLSNVELNLHDSNGEAGSGTGTGIFGKVGVSPAESATTTKPETKQTQPQGGTKYQTYHVTMNIDAQSIDDLRKLKKLLSELDGDNDPVTA